MKVIIKPLTNEHGHTDSCHVAEWGELNLKNSFGWLRLHAYANKNAFIEGKPSTMTRNVKLSFDNIEKLRTTMDGTGHKTPLRTR